MGAAVKRATAGEAEEADRQGTADVATDAKRRERPNFNIQAFYPQDISLEGRL